MEEPFLKSVKVEPSMVSRFICSDKKAVTSVVGATPVALAVGTVLTTVGASVMSGGNFMCDQVRKPQLGDGVLLTFCATSFP